MLFLIHVCFPISLLIFTDLSISIFLRIISILYSVYMCLLFASCLFAWLVVRSSVPGVIRQFVCLVVCLLISLCIY